MVGQPKSIKHQPTTRLRGGIIIITTKTAVESTWKYKPPPFAVWSPPATAEARQTAWPTLAETDLAFCTFFSSTLRHRKNNCCPCGISATQIRACNWSECQIAYACIPADLDGKSIRCHVVNCQHLSQQSHPPCLHSQPTVLLQTQTSSLLYPNLSSPSLKRKTLPARLQNGMQLTASRLQPGSTKLWHGGDVPQTTKQRRKWTPQTIYKHSTNPSPKAGTGATSTSAPPPAPLC